MAAIANTRTTNWKKVVARIFAALFQEMPYRP
jgi:hypothetical protein